MDPTRFDDLARLVAARPTRRRLVGLLVGLVGGALAARAPAPVAAACGAGCVPCPGFPDNCLCCGEGALACCPKEQPGGCVLGGQCCVDTDCPGAFVCQGARCVCPEGLTACSGSCTDTSRDEANCGRCGHACRRGQACCDGACVPCPRGGSCAGQACVCPPDRPDNCLNLVCIDPKKGVGSLFCGGCGALPCGIGERCCDGACTDVRRSLANCGDCGVLCAAAGLPECCGGACVDLLDDPANCGSCGRACLPGQTCGGGHCRGRPRPPCRGRCGRFCACPDGSSCVRGRCTPAS